MGTISAILHSPCETSSQVRASLWQVLNSLYMNCRSRSLMFSSKKWMIFPNRPRSSRSLLLNFSDCRIFVTSMLLESIVTFSFVKTAIPGLLDFISEFSSHSISYLERSRPVSRMRYLLKNWVRISMLTDPSLLATLLQMAMISSSAMFFWMKAINSKNSALVTLSGSLPRILLRLMLLECRWMRRLDRMKFRCVDPSLFAKFLSNLLLKMGCRKIFSQSNRFLSSLCRHPIMKSFIGSLITISAGKTISRVVISFLNPCWVFSWNTQGILPTSISQVITPRDQMSHLQVYFSSLRIWGAMQLGVPTRVRRKLPVCACLANPKSASLSTSSFIMMFSGLRSRWVIPFLTSSPKPLRIWKRYFMVFFSSNLPDLRRLALRLPLWASSRTMQKLLTVSWTSQNLMMLGLFSFLLICISEQKAVLVYSSSLSLFLLTTLTAISTLVSSSMPRKTQEKAPTPSRLPRKMIYLPRTYSTCRCASWGWNSSTIIWLSYQ